MSLDISSIRQQFPYLTQEGTIYLDSAATAQKPKVVLDALMNFYAHTNANVHRGMHSLAEQATSLYEDARKTVQTFINAKHTDEVIFTRNTTESINLVAHTWARKNLNPGDIVVLTLLEHHSNIVPWLQLKEEKKINLEWIDIKEDGTLMIEQLELILAKGNVKLVSMTGQSNVMGVRPPLEKIIAMAHKANAKVLIDASQLIAHAPVDVQKLDCDFLAFSGHKLYGPAGIGVLYGKREILKDTPPFLGGGMMINEVSTGGFTPADPPARFEAGTMPAAEAVGLATAITWFTQFPWKDIQAHDHELIAHALTELQKIEGMRILGPLDAKDHHSCISFVIDGIHAHDLTDLLGQKGFALRAGHHCAQPLHKKLGVVASARLSIGIYTTKEEIDACASAIYDASSRFR